MGIIDRSEGLNTVYIVRHRPGVTTALYAGCSCSACKPLAVSVCYTIDSSMLSPINELTFMEIN